MVYERAQNLREEQHAALAAKATARGVSPEEYAWQVLDQDLNSPDEPGATFPT